MLGQHAPFLSFIFSFGGLVDEEENCIQTFIYQCINCFPMHYHMCSGRASRRNETRLQAVLSQKAFPHFYSLFCWLASTIWQKIILALTLIEKEKGFICYLVNKCSGVYQPAATFKFSSEKQFSRLNLSVIQY